MDLNNDVVTEILLRLPVHSVLRFKSVCKSWCNIIDSSAFRESHLQNQSKNNVNDEDETLILQFTDTCNTHCTWDVSTYNTDNGKSRKSFPAITEFLNDKGWAYFLVAGPVNGLICMYNATPYSEGYAWDPSIAIYNPCLDKIKILPVSPICSSLSYDSWRMSEFKWVLGFGFDSVMKDYKVVQLTSFSDGRRTRVEVCSGTTNAWRELVIDDDELFLYNIEGIKSCANMNSGSWAHFKMENVILSFDMQNEVFETIPYLVLEDRPYLYLGLYEVFAKDDDSFALFLPSSDYERIEVCEVERSGDKERGWNHVRDVDAVPFSHGVYFPRVIFSHWVHFPRVIALWKRDGIVLTEYIPAWWKRDWIIWKKYIPAKRNLIFYDYSTDKVIKCCEMPTIALTAEVFLGYKDSLILP